MPAKSTLLMRVRHLARAASLEQLTDLDLSDSDHNGAAGLLRRGLGIIAFNVLEDFLKAKSKDSLRVISNSGISFSNLTDELRIASTIRATEALAFRANLEKKAGRDWLSLIQDEALKIHSTKTVDFELSSLSFGSNGSNLLSADIKHLLRALGIQGGFAALKTISDRIGGGIPDLAQCYDNLHERRNSAAHSASFDYNSEWLVNAQHEITAIAATLDIALSDRCRKVVASPSSRIDSHPPITEVKIRFLEEASGSYRETLTLGGASRKNWTNRDSAVREISSKLLSRNEFLVEIGTNRRIRDWHT